MLAELRSDNERLVGSARDVHFVGGGFDHVASMACSKTGLTKPKGALVPFECGRKGWVQRANIHKLKRRPL